MRRKTLGAVALIVLVIAVPFIGIAQEAPTLPSDVQAAADSALDKALTYIDSIATYLGQGVLYLLNIVTGDRVSGTLQKPIGYLAIITLILVFFSLLDAARKIIWIGIIVGWALLIVRVILDALNI